MIEYLTIEEVIEIHDDAIRKDGGLPGLRDKNSLWSAIDAPKAFFFEEEMYPTVYDKAAVYLYHIIQNHPFNDANKRTALGVAMIFLNLNNAEIRFFPEDLEYLVVEIAKGNKTKEEIVKWLRKEPNKETIQAMKDSRENRTIKCDSIEDFWKKMEMDL